jgi:hypothetical protein
MALPPARQTDSLSGWLAADPAGFLQKEHKTRESRSEKKKKKKKKKKERGGCKKVASESERDQGYKH